MQKTIFIEFWNMKKLNRNYSNILINVKEKELIYNKKINLFNKKCSNAKFLIINHPLIRRLSCLWFQINHFNKHLIFLIKIFLKKKIIYWVKQKVYFIHYWLNKIWRRDRSDILLQCRLIINFHLIIIILILIALQILLFKYINEIIEIKRKKKIFKLIISVH